MFSRLFLIVPHLATSIFSVSVGDKVPCLTALTCGVPQGAVLGLVLFSLYVLPMGVLLQYFNGSFQFYADDTEVGYLSV